MRRYEEKPDEGSLVVIEIEDINPHSVYGKLEEYPGKEGLIHISEVSRSWVRDIKKHVKEGEKEVALVLGEEDSGQLSLSLKRVNEKQKREKMQEWNKEKKADKFIEKVAEKVGEEPEELYEKLAFPLQEEFGNTFDGFEAAVVDRKEVEELIDEKYIDAVAEVAEKNISLKRVKLEGEMEIEVPSGTGIKVIKNALATEKDGVEISYISAPKYEINVWGRNQEQAKKRMENQVDEIRDRIEEANGVFSFQRA